MYGSVTEMVQVLELPVGGLAVRIRPDRLAHLVVAHCGYREVPVQVVLLVVGHSNHEVASRVLGISRATYDCLVFVGEYQPLHHHLHQWPVADQGLVLEWHRHVVDVLREDIVQLLRLRHRMESGGFGIDLDVR